MQVERNTVSTVYDLREAAVEHGKALAAIELDPSAGARDHLIETKLELEEKTVAALDECEGGAE